MTHSDKAIALLIDEASRRHYSRRQLIRRGAALGLSAPAIAAAVSVVRPVPAWAQDAANPLGVDASAPLDVVIFKGGFGDNYALKVNDMYKAAFPEAEIAYLGTQRLGPQFQPRFVSGDPPDIMDNSGADNLPIATLVAEGQLADLSDLMAAPAFDTEGSTVADTLIPGSQGTAFYDGVQRVFLYAETVYGIWHNQALFAEKGWTYPETWDDMMALCAEIKGAGIAPWTYQGQYPQYIRLFFDTMVAKNGGLDNLINIDNLQPDAWKQESVANVVNALAMLADNDYIMDGTEALSHTESQAAWLEGKAAFIPCGTWLENEMADLIPEGFEMVVDPPPSLAGDVLPFAAIGAWAGENFQVSEQGKNVQGGKEWLRMLASKEAARFFSEDTKSLTVVSGAADGLDLGAAFASAQTSLANAGANTIYSRYTDWYPPLNTETQNQFGALMTKQVTAEEFMDNMQAAADAVAGDDSIPKYTRES